MQRIFPEQAEELAIPVWKHRLELLERRLEWVVGRRRDRLTDNRIVLASKDYRDWEELGLVRLAPGK